MTGRPALVLLVLTAALATGCGDSSPAFPSGANVPFSQTDLIVGTGVEAVAGRSLTVHYTLWLYDAAGVEFKGRQIQSSVGGAPFPFTLGAGRVIRGWDQGVVGMRVGGRRRLVIPPDLAYGPGGQPPDIPPNATLVFDIEVLAIQ